MPNQLQPYIGQKSTREKSAMLVGFNDSEYKNITEILSFSFESIFNTSVDSATQFAPDKPKADLILVDVDDNFTEKMNYAEKLRQQSAYEDVPLIAIISKDDPEQRLAIYSNGFDDCISKPYYALELMARIQARLKWVKKYNCESQNIRIGNLELNKSGYEARIENRSIRLTSLELRLLEFLINNSGKVLTRESILSNVWSDTSVLARTVDSHIVTLRKKIAGSDHSIRTIFGAGYIFGVFDKSFS